MAASAEMTLRIDQLIALFNRRSMDLPDGLFTRETQFLLNGVPFEQMLGRSPNDPLILMLARGPAGYRFVAKAVQHALPDARLERGELEDDTASPVRVIRGQCWLSGHLRGTSDAAEMLVGVEMILRGAVVERMSASMDQTAVDKLRAARLRP